MLAEMVVGCSGWNYPDRAENGGWVGSFYPRASTKMLRYYSQYFATAEMDSTFYEKFYSKMGQGTFIGMSKATPEGFQFSIKVPETITHKKKLNVSLGAMRDFEEFLEKIAPLRKSNKLGAILLQLGPSFSVNDFKSIEGFLDKLPRGYDYAVEFRHPSWKTEGPWELLRHYNIAAVMTDSGDPNLKFLSEPIVSADHALIRFHGRSQGFWYDYLYTKDDLKTWVPKVEEVRDNTRVLRVYFNDHPMGKAVASALKFEEVMGQKLTLEQKKAEQQVIKYLEKVKERKQGQTGLAEFTA